jgi:hypothetical protein
MRAEGEMGQTDDGLQAFQINPPPEVGWHLFEAAGELDPHPLRDDLRRGGGETGGGIQTIRLSALPSSIAGLVFLERYGAVG